MRAHPLSLVMLAVLTALANPASAQQKFQMLGPNECLNCHDHNAERDWYEKKEIPEVQRLFPDKGANAGHINSLNQMEAKDSDKYAKAIGLADKYDVNGKCVSCHATVYRGDANAGVSCESCHGPGSGYLKPHQTKDTYEQSVAQYGMTKLIGNIQGWTQQCTNCHVMDDQKLIDAGHPSGNDFDLSKKFVPVSLHFKKKYTDAEIAAIAGPQMQAILRYRRGETAAAAAAPAPATPAAAAPAPAAAPEPAPAAPAPAAAAPAAPAAAARPAPAAVAPVAAAPAAAAPAKPIDLANPPAGSPTSIEPKFPIAVPAPAAAAPAPAAAAAPPPAPAPTTPAGEGEPLPIGALSIGVIALAAIGGFFWWKSRKK